MKAIGIVLAILGGGVVLVTVQGLMTGKHHFENPAATQGFVGGIAGGIILAAIGLRIANKKTPPTT
jgi:hypothetical protein